MKMLGVTQPSGKVIPWTGAATDACLQAVPCLNYVCILTTIAHADRVIFAIAANVSIASLNLSLMINSVGFYQIAKLLIIPFTAVVQSVWLKESLTLAQAACTAVVLLGVAIVCVPEAVPVNRVHLQVVLSVAEAVHLQHMHC